MQRPCGEIKSVEGSRNTRGQCTDVLRTRECEANEDQEVGRAWGHSAEVLALPAQGHREPPEGLQWGLGVTRFNLFSVEIPQVASQRLT